MDSQVLFSSFAFVSLSAVAVVYLLTGVIFRLFYSPIAHFPGPKIAAVTYWYEFYYDVVCGGQYIWKVEHMHDKYGPVVRINPDELHVADPDFYAVLYSTGQDRRDKVFKYTRQFGAPDSVLAAVPHELHRMRRATLSPFFSKASVYRLEPSIQDKIDDMIDHMEQFKISKEPLPLLEMFAALTNDVVMEYAFARSERRLAKPDFDPEMLHALTTASEVSHWILHMNWILRLLQSIPVRLAKILNPGLGKIVAFQDSVKDQIRDIQEGRNLSNQKSSHRTIFHEVLDSDMPESEKKLERMWQEGMVVVGAGTETTAWTFVVGLVNILLNPAIRQLLEDEIKAAKAENDYIQLKEMEQLPYLSACIKESLRLSYGVTSRLPRVAPNQVLEVPGTRLPIPAGTKISMTSVMIHHNPKLFPLPYQFRPERWLDNPRLDRYLVSFSKGARQCLGMNLAYAELYMGLTAIFSRFPVSGDGPLLQLVSPATSLADIEIAGDLFVPATKSGKKGPGVRFQ